MELFDTQGPRRCHIRFTWAHMGPIWVPMGSHGSPWVAMGPIGPHGVPMVVPWIPTKP